MGPSFSFERVEEPEAATTHCWYCVVSTHTSGLLAQDDEHLSADLRVLLQEILTAAMTLRLKYTFAFDNHI